MSHVSGVTLQISCAEDGNNDAHATVCLVDQINAWLKERDFMPLVSVEDRYGGSKHPQVYIYGAGFNGFDEDDFAAYVLSLPWNVPESLVLLIQPEAKRGQPAS